MKMTLSAKQLHILIAVYLGETPFLCKETTEKTAAAFFVNHDMAVAELEEQRFRILSLTERGKFFVKHLLTIPLPKELKTFCIPEATEK